MTQPPQTTAPTKLLRIDASARTADSVTRQLTDAVVQRVAAQGSIEVLQRDLSATPPAYVNEAWVNANFTSAEERSDAQRQTLAASDALVQELMDADILVIGVPLYNFGIPAALKAWVDMVARARLTFRYTETGVEGLLKGKHAYILLASGGTPAGSDIDFASGYLRHILGFIGITNVEIIAADQIGQRGEDAVRHARARIHALQPRGYDAGTVLAGTA